MFFSLIAKTFCYAWLHKSKAFKTFLSLKNYRNDSLVSSSYLQSFEQKAHTLPRNEASCRTASKAEWINFRCPCYKGSTGLAACFGSDTLSPKGVRGERRKLEYPKKTSDSLPCELESHTEKVPRRNLNEDLYIAVVIIECLNYYTTGCSTQDKTIVLHLSTYLQKRSALNCRVRSFQFKMYILQLKGETLSKHEAAGSWIIWSDQMTFLEQNDKNSTLLSFGNKPLHSS